jgi:hypothetical protein
MFSRILRNLQQLMWFNHESQSYRICACISRTLTIYPQKLACGLYTEYYVLTPEPATSVLYVVKLPVETASVWDLSCKLKHARMRQRSTGVSAYIDYMRVANTIDSQKLEDRNITDKLP